MALNYVSLYTFKKYDGYSGEKKFEPPQRLYPAVFTGCKYTTNAVMGIAANQIL
jgi:hypothetical protein